MSDIKTIDGEKAIEMTDDELVKIRDAIESGEFELVDEVIELLTQKQKELDEASD